MKLALNQTRRSNGRVLFVSEGHLKESLTTRRGYGLDGIFRWLLAIMRSIHNGIRAQKHRPENMPALEEKGRNAETRLEYAFVKPKKPILSMTPDEVGAMKGQNAIALQAKLGLEVNADNPIFGAATRIAKQKGFNLWMIRLPEDGSHTLGTFSSHAHPGA